ncbi:MAG TPA: bifunctional phosphopantothenoylcysteine decarboxylase/phosphopantothenate--cysteine ligase CoaBC [Deltaproteobacteria bacterium]|nr:bifunctional phosphopantothenoylcysteine decarboxylase/phosphopantothenate--cysteine ligase CoaBC [Deltaproteobacteria bacterium]
MNGKEVILGVTGGIAAYKSAELVRLMVKDDILVRVAMTKSATKFVTPLTFEALSGESVIHDMFGQEGTAIDHIQWGQESDLIIIAPATANFIGKMAHGIGDDFLSTCVIAATAKILVCPSMNTRMFENPVVQDNLDLLKKRGFIIMEPGQGALACGTEGPGRLPEPDEILEQARKLLSDQDLSGLKILVTAGPTTEPIDPVRYISNRSSGKMGYALARAAACRGADVILVSGPTDLAPPPGLSFCQVITAEDMRRSVFENRSGCDIIIKAAAVSDYRPRDCAEQKIKKGAESLSLELIKNPDILAELGSTVEEFPSVLVGFAAETEDLIVNAEKKLKSKNLDMIVANDVSSKDAGFETDTNRVKIIYSDGHVDDSPLMTKDKVADLVLDRAKAIREAGLEG